MGKTLFLFRVQVCENPTDSKKNYFAILQVQRGQDGTKFKFPLEYTNAKLHDAVTATDELKAALQVLKRRGHYRTVRILLDDHATENYTDKAGNMIFQGCMLEEVLESDPIQKIVEKHTETEKKERPLASLIKDIVLDTFENKNQNAQLWLESFERSCLHANIEQKRFSQALHFFIAGPVTTWYALVQKQIENTENWRLWKDSFLEVYSERGWSAVRYAYGYKYISGSFIDFALKKINLLLKAEPKIGEISRVNHVVLSLPPDIVSKIPKKTTISQQKLLEELNSLETFAKKDSRSSKFPSKPKQDAAASRSPINRKPCSFCAKIGLKDKLHLES